MERKLHEKEITRKSDYRGGTTKYIEKLLKQERNYTEKRII